MFFVPLSNIIIGPRQRTVFNEQSIADLAASIRDKGLMHALVVRAMPGDGGGNPQTFQLIAGERRSRAIHSLYAAEEQVFYNGIALPVGCVPCVEITNVDSLRAREAELEENILREDLTWQDRQRAVTELHALRKAANPTQTVTATAQELSARAPERSVSALRKEIAQSELVQQFADDPDVQRAKSLNEAHKIASRKAEIEFAAALASVTPPSKHTLRQGDVHEHLAQLNSGMFDVILSDPPYGMDADSFGDAASLAHQYHDDLPTAEKIWATILQEGFRVAKPQALLFMFCDLDNFHVLREAARMAQWHVQRTPLVWNKGNAGHVPDGAVGFRRVSEYILFASKGGRKIRRIHSDVIPASFGSTERTHAAQKPVELYRILLDLSCLPGDHVLDPTCGSGTIFRAADALKLTATGIEQNELYVNQCKAAIASLAGGPSAS